MSDLQNTVLVTSAILIGSFFSYLLQFILGRGLSVADYGTFNALLSITAVVGVPATVFGTSLIKKVSNLYAKNEHKEIGALFWHSSIWALSLGIIIFGFFSLFKNDIFSYLKVDDASLILAFTLYIGLNFLWTIPYYFLQGLLKYKLFAFTVIFSNILRFSLPALALFTKGNLDLIFYGIILSMAISYFVSLYLIKDNLKYDSQNNVGTYLWDILKFSLPVMGINLCLISFNNSDLILVRTNFSAEMAGYYAGVITLGKILLFGATPVATVMYPKLAAAKSKGDAIWPLYKKFFGMQFLVVFAGFLLFLAFPKLVAVAFFGEKFLGATPFLPFYSLTVVLYVLLNFLILFLLAMDVSDFYSVLIFLAFGQVIAITKMHATLYQIITINLIIFALADLYLLFRSRTVFK